MDVVNQFHQIGILLTNNRLVPILEEMTVPMVALIAY
jgi:hypothetical protein